MRVPAGHGHFLAARLARVSRRPNMVPKNIRFTPLVWAKVEARARRAQIAPTTLVRRLVETAVEDDPEPSGTPSGTPAP